MHGMPMVVMALLVQLGTAALAQTRIEINACGQSFQGAAFLSADLDCSGFAGSAVTIEQGTLDLQGFTILAGQLHGVVCETSCTIVGGGGSIRGAGVDGIHNAGKRLSVRDLTIAQSGRHGIGAPALYPWMVRRSRVELSGSLIETSGQQGLNARRAYVTDSTLARNGRCGIYVPKNAVVTGSNVSENGDDGIYGEGTVELSDSTVTNNHSHGVWGVRKTIVSNATVTGNQSIGVSGQKTTVTNSTITGNQSGVRGSKRFKGVDSTICSNGTDLVETGRLVLQNTACEGSSTCLSCAP